MSYSGLGTLFENEGGASASITAGGREALAQASDLQNILAKQQEIEKAKQMNPLDLAYRQGQIDAQVPELQQAKNKAALSTATLPSDIETKIATNKKIYSSDQLDTLNNMGKMAGNIGALLSGVPEGLPREQAARAWMQDNGIPIESKVGQYILNNTPEKLMDVSKQISQLTSSYIQSQGTSQVQAGAHLQGIREQQQGAKSRQEASDATKLEIAKLRAQKANNIIEQVKLGKLNYEKAATAFETLADLEDNVEMQQKYRELASKFAAENLKKAPAQINPAAIPGAPLQTPQTGLGKGGGPAAGTAENPIKLD